MFADFVPSTPVLAAYLFAAVILALTPGPDMTLFLSKTVAHSRRAGLAALAGASTGLVIHSCLVAAGLSVLLAASATAFTVLKIVGAVYLVYLAVDALRHGSALSLDRKLAREPIRSVYFKGVLIDLLNPKVIIFFVTFLPSSSTPTTSTRGRSSSSSASPSPWSTSRSARCSSSSPTASPRS